VNRLPRITFAIVAGALFIAAAPALGEWFIYDRERIFASELWRLFTGHFVHLSGEHLLLDLTAFAIIGAITERKQLPGFGLLCLIAPCIISAGSLLIEPRMHRYAGLSALSMAAFVFFAFHQNRRAMIVLLTLAAAKIIFELTSNTSIFVTAATPKVRIAATSHLLGALVGALFALPILLAFRRCAGQSKSALKVLIIPDKFKGTLTARQAAEAIAEGWRGMRPNDELELLPMSDGGDGFGEIIGGMMGAEPIAVDTIDAAHRLHTAHFWFDHNTKTAVIEAAQVNGLALLPPGKYHPFELDTFGLGKVYMTAAEMKASKIVVGIGGSSTNDGGFGFAKALGYQFLNSASVPIQKWTSLESLDRIVMSGTMPFIETIVGVDVQNPLLGPNGASRIYGPQKGLREEDMAKAEACLNRMADVVHEINQRPPVVKWMGKVVSKSFNFAERPGAGAAGGLGFGLEAFVGANFVPGFDIFAEAANLDKRLKEADFVISGEGAMDEQSLMGKGVGSLCQLCRDRGVKFLGLAGSLSKQVGAKFASDRNLALFGIVPGLASLDQAKAEPAKYLRLLAAEAAKKAVSA
jgi:glycerate 2-kinase